MKGRLKPAGDAAEGFAKVLTRHGQPQTLGSRSETIHVLHVDGFGGNLKRQQGIDELGPVQVDECREETGRLVAPEYLATHVVPYMSIAMLFKPPPRAMHAVASDDSMDVVLKESLDAFQGEKSLRLGLCLVLRREIAGGLRESALSYQPRA
jgi:hypothetical protein